MTTNQSELVETILSILGVTDRTSGNRPEQIATLEQEIAAYITADRKRVAIEARENISKLYEKELEMHRKFMDSVIANNQLKTTVMYCIKCGTELLKLQEQPNDQL